jgi:hypothetical protein
VVLNCGVVKYRCISSIGALRESAHYCDSRNTKRTPWLAGCSCARTYLYGKLSFSRIESNCAGCNVSWSSLLYLFVAYCGLLFGVVAVAMTRSVDYISRKLAPSTLQAVLNRVDHRVNDTQIYYQTSVTKTCTRQKRRNLESWGQPYAPKCVKLGRPSMLQDLHRRRLLEFLKGRPQAYLEEIRD